MASESKTIDEPVSQDAIFGFECLRNIRNGKVDLAGVGKALGYKNVNSVANRFRRMRDKYGFSGLDCALGNASPSKGKAASSDNNNGSPPKRGPGRPPKKATKKGAKVSTADPIPATGPVVNSEDNSGEENSKSGENVSVEVQTKDI
ncbi:hypothetical protein BJX76DRAFT_358866 [Aspergillus varians]